MDADKKNELIEAITKRVLAALSHPPSEASTPPDAPKITKKHSDDALPRKPPGMECVGHGPCENPKEHTMRKMIDLGAVRFGHGPGLERPSYDVARRIDHTLLKQDATREELQKICDEARKYHFATVCVNSSNIPFVAGQLKGSDVKPIAVVGFPLGAGTTNAKVYEAVEAVRNGAEEIDMVINIGSLKSKDYRYVLEDISAVVKASAPHKVKVILETAMLENDEKISGCVLAKAAGAAFVKTSTGFGPGGATVADIELMRRIVGEDMEVKASGGIRNREDALKMIEAGADRLGASASIAIVEGRNAGGGKY